MCISAVNSCGTMNKLNPTMLQRNVVTLKKRNMKMYIFNNYFIRRNFRVFKNSRNFLDKLFVNWKVYDVAILKSDSFLFEHHSFCLHIFP